MALFITTLIVLFIAAIPVYNLMTVFYRDREIEIWKIFAFVVILAGIAVIAQAWMLF